MREQRFWIKISNIDDSYDTTSFKDALEDLLKDNFEKFRFKIDVVEIDE